MLGSQNKNVLESIEKNTRLESYDIDTVNYSLVYPISVAIVTGANLLLTNTITLPSKLRSPIRLYGFNYVIRMSQPFVATNPKVGIAISKYNASNTLWTSNVNAQYEGVYHVGHHSSLPVQNEVTYNMPRFLNQEDNLEVNLFVENDTGVSFSTTLKCHITLYYRLAETRKYNSLR